MERSQERVTFGGPRISHVAELTIHTSVGHSGTTIDSGRRTTQMISCLPEVAVVTSPKKRVVERKRNHERPPDPGFQIEPTTATRIGGINENYCLEACRRVSCRYVDVMRRGREGENQSLTSIIESGRALLRPQVFQVAPHPDSPDSTPC